jgi:hypothetical protein
MFVWVLLGKQNAKECLCQMKLVEATNVKASSYNGFHEVTLQCGNLS